MELATERFWPGELRQKQIKLKTKWKPATERFSSDEIRQKQIKIKADQVEDRVEAGYGTFLVSSDSTQADQV